MPVMVASSSLLKATAKDDFPKCSARLSATVLRTHLPFPLINFFCKPQSQAAQVLTFASCLQSLGSLTNVIQVLSEAGQSRGISLTSFQLSLVQRDFNESDYDALLALDVEVVRSKAGQISSKHLKKLETYKHPAR